jgi:hypothetical protein
MKRKEILTKTKKKTETRQRKKTLKYICRHKIIEREIWTKKKRRTRECHIVDKKSRKLKTGMLLLFCFVF